ncbi:unnamed protein product [Fraxinus pennsylvanica]|uniref:Uncharacterized protein n=1 Tax=Fraxinus pennsylvanica TaxID=56036 RepID=A0AAD1Z861_9LAMI|nr:unnamed protein product [Fraxinus pennsylvanica]
MATYSYCPISISVDAGLGLFRGFHAVEFSKLVSPLRPDEPEDVIVSSCQILTTFFQQRQEQKIVFITQHGLLPLMELLEVPRTRVCSPYQAQSLLLAPTELCDICYLHYWHYYYEISGHLLCAASPESHNQRNTDFQENACLVGLMSLTVDSPIHSSSSDDFVAILDAELDSASDASPDSEGIEEKQVEYVVDDDDDDYNSNHRRYSNK